MAWLSDPTFEGAVLGGGSILVWFLALYVASRAPTRRAPLLAALAMLCLAIYLLGEALGNLAPDLESWGSWLRRTWWAPSLALPVWLTVTLALAADEGPADWATRVQRALLPIAIVAIATGAVFGVIGVLTKSVQDWDHP